MTLFLCITNGKTKSALDLPIHGEEGNRAEKHFWITREQCQ